MNYILYKVRTRQIRITDQNNGVWSWSRPLSISRRFELVSLAPVVPCLFMRKKYVFCVVALRQKGRKWKFGMRIMFLYIIVKNHFLSKKMIFCQFLAFISCNFVCLSSLKSAKNPKLTCYLVISIPIILQSRWIPLKISKMRVKDLYN